MNGLLEVFAERIPKKVDWKRISKCYSLTEDFIRLYFDKLDWRMLSRYQVLSEEIIREFKNLVDWRYIALTQKLSEEFIEMFAEEFSPYWRNLIMKQRFSAAFIESNLHRIDWGDFYSYRQVRELSFDFVMENYKLFGVHNIKYKIEQEGRIPTNEVLNYLPKNSSINFKKLPPIDFLKKNRKYASSISFSQIAELDEQILLEFKNEIHWPRILTNRLFPISFLVKIQSEATLSLIVAYQKLDIDFLEKNKYNIDWGMLARSNPFLCEKTVNHFGSRVELAKLGNSLRRENYSIDFVRKHKDSLSWYALTTNYFYSITEEEASEFADYLDWKKLANRKLPVDIVKSHKDKFQGFGYSPLVFPMHSLDELHEIKDIINWQKIAFFIKDASIIEAFPEYVDWLSCSRFEPLNDDIILKYWDKLHWDYIAVNPSISKEVCESLFDQLLSKFTLSSFKFTVFYNHRKFPVS